MDERKPYEVVEAYKQRISDLIDEAEKAIGYQINTVDISPKQGLMNRRGVVFNINLWDTATIKKIFAGEQHYAMKALAKQYGWTYKVTKN